MKIEYDMSNNYKNLYNEANGVLTNLNRLGDKKKIYTFTDTIVINFVTFEFLAFLILFISLLIKFKITLIISLIVIILGLVYLILGLYGFKKALNNPFNSKSGTLEIKKLGIVDKSNNGNKTSVKYSDIDSIVITKNLFVIVLKNTLMVIFVPNKKSKEFIKTIKSYTDTKIIEI